MMFVFIIKKMRNYSSCSFDDDEISHMLRCLITEKKGVASTLQNWRPLINIGE